MRPAKEDVVMILARMFYIVVFYGATQNRVHVIAKRLEMAVIKSMRADLRCIILETTEARHATVRARLQVLIETLNRR